MITFGGACSPITDPSQPVQGLRRMIGGHDANEHAFEEIYTAPCVDTIVDATRMSMSACATRAHSHPQNLTHLHARYSQSNVSAG